MSISITSQTTQLKTLKEVLVELSDLYEVKFSFYDEVINGKKVIFIKEKKDELEIVIKNLELQSQLFFRKISNNRYIILKPKKKKVDICGTITSLNSKEPLVGATITLKNKSIGVETDINGAFQLKNIELKDTIRFSYIGYTTKEKVVEELLSNTCASISLKEEDDVLNEVVITNYLTNGISKTIDGAVVFKPKNQDIIPGLTEPDVFYTVQQLPGIVNVDETATGMHIRGGTPDQNLILFDQIKLFTASHFFGAISALNPETIDRVEVYRRASNAKYGNHIGGVIDVETTNTVPKKIKGSVGVNFTHVDANLNIPISKKLSLLVSGRRSITDVLNTPTYRELSQKTFQYTVISDDERIASEVDADINTVAFFQDFNTKILYKPTDNDKISLSQIGIKNSLNHSFASSTFNDNKKDELLIENKGYNLTWDRSFGKKISSKVAVSYSDYDLRYRNNKQKDGVQYAFTEKDNRISNLEINTSVGYKIGTNTLLTLGYQYAFNKLYFLLGKKNDYVFVESYSTQNDSNESHTVFYEYLYNQNKDFTVSIGNRVNYFSLLDKVTFEPRAFAQVKILPKFWLNSSYERKQQNITRVVEFYTTDFGLENQLWSLSNKNNIPLLESEQITLGAFLQNNNWLIDLDVYRRNISGITSLTSGFDSFTNELFIGRSKTIGLDFLVKKSWKNYNAWISYHTGKTSFVIDQINDGNEFNGNFDVAHSLYIANNFKYNNFNFSLGFTYRGGIPFTSNSGLANNYFIVRNGVNDRRLPDYHRLDFSAGYDFYMNRKKTLKGRINLSFLNVYNKKNILKRGYDVVQDNTNGFEESKLVEQNTESLGFTPNVSFRVSF
ncbi:putative outer membrane protein probably involved in nutrient binding [Tenacibaculum amylolyticum]